MASFWPTTFPLLLYLISNIGLPLTQAHPSRSSKENFISVKNGTFYKDCEPTYLVSMNYWSAMNLAASDVAGGNLSRFQTEVKQMADRGVNNVRIMAASEASGRGIQPFRMYPALQESPGVYNEEIFVGLDRALVEFAKHDISVIMTLHNFWQWSGGYSQYVSWATSDSEIPYPPSWDPALNPPYGDYTTNGTYDEFTQFSARFYNDTSITNTTQTWFRNHIFKVINRVNTITGVAYKDDPTIMTWELTNEPQEPPLTNHCEHAFRVVDSAKYIKSLAPHQLVTVGFEGKNGEWWFKRVHAPDVIDYACGHLWVQNWGYYDPLDPTDGNLTLAESFATGFLRNLSQWSLDLKKPVILEEFGMARDNWENVAKGAPTQYYLYSAEANTTHKDRYFKFVISSVVDYYKKGLGWHGTGPWAYGGIWRPTDAKNKFNMSWAGDPPHEADGWYDLYDTDNAMQIVQNQADEVQEFLDSIKTSNSSSCSPKLTSQANSG
ncbi:family 5 glycoside hydrolase [Melampsora larici-populina 98AG31]|uniref:mannan endo-1,4-beta-mannosidase n=1 Tax=Melampsora larici-populina (strain 98AG31 / pathotype 3-4-7) TaxID=747676 RepID=F4R3J9_MELLP|nr:family 5 glycoside hydrolase [Melampsora larici-populina 98AG31]EGG12641.1 family 5 glycoside hydrolase [Melampsora larici-populina 98AG31]